MPARALFGDEFGPTLPSLPWDDSAGARQWLLHRAPEYAARLAAFSAELRQAWMHSRPAHRVIAALGGLFPGARACVFPGAPPPRPRWYLHDFGGLPTDSYPVGSEQMSQGRHYVLYGREPLANRPVNLPTLGRRRTPRGMQGLDFVMSTVFHPNLLHHQLRVVLYEGEALRLLVGLYRWKTERPFSVEEHAALHAVQGEIDDFVRTAECIGFAPVGADALPSVLDALPRAAFLLDGDRIVFANQTGRALRITARDVAEGALGHGAVRQQIPCGRTTLTLVMGSVGATRALLRPGLPPTLARVAELLTRGLSDKQIANELGLTHATARTYVGRVFEKLGVHDRRELMGGDA